MKKFKRKDTSWHRFFRPEKSPHSIFSFNKETNLFEYSYVPKHDKSRGVIIWDSKKKGTFMRQKKVA
jgi:hypothetical protein